MGMEIVDAEVLLDSLTRLNQRLFSLDAIDPDGLRKALDHRSKLMSALGRRLRDHADFPQWDSEHFRGALDQALEEGEIAVQRLLLLHEATGSAHTRCRSSSSA